MYILIQAIYSKIKTNVGVTQRVGKINLWCIVNRQIVTRLRF